MAFWITGLKGKRWASRMESRAFTETTNGLAMFPCGKNQPDYFSGVGDNVPDTEQLPKSVVERLVGIYNNPKTPFELRQSILENPRTASGLLDKTEKLRGPKPKERDPNSLTLQRLRNALTLLFRLTGKAEGLLAGLAEKDRQVLEQMLPAVFPGALAV